ncbi:MAG: PTS sugar transporter subunit IIA [bacterium]
MLLGKYMSEDLIICNLTSKGKMEVIEEMVELFVKTGVVKNKEEFCTTIRKREELESTAIGGGIAIPHGRSNSVKELKVAFARSKDGVDFKAMDKKPVHIIFMIAAPLKDRKKYLQIVAKIARLLKSKIMQEALLKTETPKDVMELIQDFDKMLIEEIKIKTKKGKIVYRK